MYFYCKINFTSMKGTSRNNDVWWQTKSAQNKLAGYYWSYLNCILHAVIVIHIFLAGISKRWMLDHTWHRAENCAAEIRHKRWTMPIMFLKAKFTSADKNIFISRRRHVWSYQREQIINWRFSLPPRTFQPCRFISICLIAYSCYYF